MLCFGLRGSCSPYVPHRMPRLLITKSRTTRPSQTEEAHAWTAPGHTFRLIAKNPQALLAPASEQRFQQANTAKLAPQQPPRAGPTARRGHGAGSRGGVNWRRPAFCFDLCSSFCLIIRPWTRMTGAAVCRAGPRRGVSLWSRFEALGPRSAAISRKSIEVVKDVVLHCVPRIRDGHGCRIHSLFCRGLQQMVSAVWLVFKILTCGQRQIIVL